VSRRRTRRTDKKIRNQSPIPDTKPPDPSDQHCQQLPPVKRIFGYFFCNRKKSLASASAAGGETAFEFEFEVEFEVDLKAAALGSSAKTTLDSRRIRDHVIESELNKRESLQ